MDSIYCNRATVTSGSQSVMLHTYTHTAAKFAAVYSTVHHPFYCCAHFMLHTHKMDLSQEAPCQFNQYLQTRKNLSSNWLCSTQEETITKAPFTAVISGTCVSQTLRHSSRSKTEFCDVVPSWSACWRDNMLVMSYSRSVIKE
jgi:hypothetical protein